jgi:Uma2 family endonuclease
MSQPVLASAFIEMPPDWLAEALSLSTQATDRTDKPGVYAVFCVKHCWYVDPSARTNEAFELTRGKWIIANTFTDVAPATAPPFEAQTFALGVVWV